ncbi:MAG: transposase [Ardenticatenia bacterium]|nr:transposase [Ardenticatenia bacterium]
MPEASRLPRSSPWLRQPAERLRYKTLKVKAIRKRTPLSLADARAVVESFVLYYNAERLHSAIGYVTPQAMLEGRAAAIIQRRREKLDAARRKRREIHIGQAEHVAWGAFMSWGTPVARAERGHRSGRWPKQGGGEGGG